MDEAYVRDLGDLRCCSQCLEYRPRTTDHFFNDRDGPRGLSRRCKICDREYQRQRREQIYQGEREVRPVRPTDGRLKVNRRLRAQITEVIRGT